MAIQTIGPDETLDFSFDWSSFMQDSGSPTDSISTSTWSIAPADGSPSAPVLSSPSNTAESSTTFLAGCERGKWYVLTNEVVTALGRTARRSITIRCETR